MPSVYFKILHKGFSILKKQISGVSETSVNTSQAQRRHVPKDSSLPLLLGLTSQFSTK